MEIHSRQYKSLSLTILRDFLFLILFLFLTLDFIKRTKKLTRVRIIQILLYSEIQRTSTKQVMKLTSASHFPREEPSWNHQALWLSRQAEGLGLVWVLSFFHPLLVYFCLHCFCELLEMKASSLFIGYAQF